MSDSCNTFEKPTLCNCDARSFNLTDEGTLSSDLLPIYALQYGGSVTPYSLIKFSIGPLICSGKQGFYPSEAEDFEKQTLKSKIYNLTNEIAETKQGLHDLSDQLEDHMKTTTTKTTTTTTTSTRTTTTTADPKLHFEMIGRLRPSLGNKIVEITKYYHNYEFSMELKYDNLQNSWFQLLHDMVEIVQKFLLENALFSNHS